MAALANPADATPEDAARVAAAAAELLPQPERNNDQTAIWGWRKHGIRVLVMLAIAVEDPEVRSPCGYFGKLTGQDRGAADLRLNLARILKSKGGPPPPEIAPAPVVEEPPPLIFSFSPKCLFFSINKTLLPRSAARPAAIMPAGPPPMTMTSNIS